MSGGRWWITLPPASIELRSVLPLTYPPGLSDADRALFWLRCTTLRPDWRESCGPAPMPRSR